MKKTSLLLAFLLGIAACQPLAPPTDQVTFIVVNDTYRGDNFPYLRSLRAKLEKTTGDVVILHAGDFLFPSLLSQRYNGEQMVDILNLLDGDAEARDPHLFVAFGNHEFEKDKLKHAPLLQSRINESQFDWLGSNIVFGTDAAGKKLIAGEALVESRLLTVNGVKVGFVGATTDIKGAEYIDHFVPPADAIRRLTRQLRQQGAQLVVAVTHQTVNEDKAMLVALGNDAPDFVAGGHEHERKHEVVNGRHLVKADADANSAAIVRINLGQPVPSTTVEYVELPGHYPPDRALQRRMLAWNERFDRDYCSDLQRAPDCMQEVLGKSRVDLVAEELTIRRFETNLGNLLADTAREAFASQDAQIAFLNSGGMRLNYNLPAGDITRRHIDTLFAFPTQLSLIRISGRQLQEVVNHAITDWTGNGRWLQISGFAFRHDPAQQTATGLSLITPQGLRPIQPDEMLLAVTNDYLLNEAGDQDGYRMLKSAMKVHPEQATVDLKAQLIDVLARTRDTGIAPTVEGRICNLQQTPRCPLF